MSILPIEKNIIAANSDCLNQERNDHSHSHRFYGKERNLPGYIQIRTSPPCEAVYGPERDRCHKEQVIQSRPYIIVAAKWGDQNHNKVHRRNQLPFTVLHSAKQHPHTDSQRQNQENHAPLESGFLLIIFKVKHTPSAKHDKQKHNTDTIYHFAKQGKTLLLYGEKRNSRQNTQHHISHPSRSVQIGICNHPKHFSKGIIGCRACHAEDSFDHGSKGSRSIKKHHAGKHCHKARCITCYAQACFLRNFC